MYPVTKFYLEDRSYIPSLEIADTTNKPIGMAVFTSDKGTEDYIYITGQDFFNQFGNISFAKHGQPLLQAATAINAGAKLFAKRVVASDATLANIGVVAHVSSESKQKTDAEGKLLYTTADGEETTVAEGNEAIMVSTCDVKFSIISLTDYTKTNMTELAKSLQNSVTDGYLLFAIADNGRGVSAKRVRITPDYNISRTSVSTKYILDVIENNESVENIAFSLNPDLIESDENAGIENCVKTISTQIRCKAFDANIRSFFAKVSELTGLEYETVEYMDVLFGKTKKGEAISTLAVSGDITLDTVFGIPLSSGTNGAFGDQPIAAESYAKEICRAFSGSAYTEELDKELGIETDYTIDHDCIYNLENNPIDYIVDANYPEEAKRAIEALVTFREDCVYFRDLGTTAKSLAEFKVIDMLNLKNRYCATYVDWYDVIDPYTKKQITVTFGYSLSRALVSHFVNGRNRPLAGQKYDLTFPEVIDGTLNFVPKITPTVNQKEEMDDLRLNYCSYYNGVLTLESEYTSQEPYTQLSFINNVLIVQQVIKAIRQACPKIRYSFIDGTDLQRYQEDVQAVIDRYSQYFKSIQMEYVEDTTYTKNKIYYAVIRVTFKDFVQSEVFKIIALS